MIDPICRRAGDESRTQSSRDCVIRFCPFVFLCGMKGHTQLSDVIAIRDKLHQPAFPGLSEKSVMLDTSGHGRRANPALHLLQETKLSKSGLLPLDTSFKSIFSEGGATSASALRPPVVSIPSGEREMVRSPSVRHHSPSRAVSRRSVMHTKYSSLVDSGSWDETERLSARLWTLITDGTKPTELVRRRLVQLGS